MTSMPITGRTVCRSGPRRQINHLHPADIARLLEMLRADTRQMLWDLVDSRDAVAVLLELSDPVRSALIKTMPAEELVHAAGRLDSDDIADLVPDLPGDVVPPLLQRLNAENPIRSISPPVRCGAFSGEVGVSEGQTRLRDSSCARRIESRQASAGGGLAGTRRRSGNPVSHGRYRADSDLRGELLSTIRPLTRQPGVIPVHRRYA